MRERILLDEELKTVAEGSCRDWQTLFFCAKEAIYKASNPETDEFLGFKDVCVRLNQLATEYSAETALPKRSSDIVASGRGYVFSVENHWFTVFLIP
ncbi:MAG: 4-phosphopantetheinyl transferase family protein [Gammaproteobacteria bacterium]|nr:4-phosphopantetheinyl transferase family protein [Gammaproteobacteria bacterium]